MSVSAFNYGFDEYFSENYLVMKKIITITILVLCAAFCTVRAQSNACPGLKNPVDFARTIQDKLANAPLA